MSDLISREDVKKAMYHEAFEVDSDMQKWDSGCWIRYKLFENVIDSIPTADITDTEECKRCQESVERVLANAQRKGEWLNYMYSDFCKCSVCGTISSSYWNYCPNCGADMRGDVK